MYKFTSSPWGFRNYDFEKYCKFMKSIGIKEVCTFFGDPKRWRLAFPSDLKPEDIENIKSVAQKCGVSILEICGGGDYTVKENIEKEIDITKNHLDIAKKLGVKIFRVFAGWIAEKEITEETYRQISESLTEIGKYAKKYKIVIAVENHGGVTRTGEQVKKIMEKIKVDNVGVNYDPANFLYYGEDPIAALEKIQPWIVFTHFKNCKKENDKMKYCRLREGIINYKLILEKLAKTYKGYYALEYEEPSDVEEGTKDDFEYLKKLLGV